MKRRVNYLYKIFIALLICFIGNTVYAVDVNNWTDLQNNVEAGKSVTLTDNITADSSSTTISIDSSYSSVIDLSEKYISGNSSVQIFNNAGTLSISNGTIKNGLASSYAGAIYNTGVLSIKNCILTSNKAPYFYGGAIYNSGEITVLGGTFTGNSANGGGAIYNIGTITEIISGTTFSNNSAINKGGAIYNDKGGTINLGDADFTSNSLTGFYGQGGAIFNQVNSTITNSSGNYTSNSATYGGAICNAGTFTLTNATFTTNAATLLAGAIFNTGTMEITGTTFDTNSAQYGGAIENQAYVSTGTKVSKITLSSNNIFENNSATYSASGTASVTVYGGAIYNCAIATTGSATATINISDSSFTSNSASATSLGGTASAMGGAIANTYSKTTGTATATITLDNATFDKNSVTAVATGSSDTTAANALGGAIYNTGIVDITDSNFTNNSASATSTSGSTYAYGFGGAIYNSGTLTANGASFSGNTAADGGAIYNSGIATFVNSTFTGNTATGNGGAIYNSGTLYLQADGSQTIFSGNEASGIHNGLYNAGTVYLNAGNGGSIVFDDTVNSASIANEININSTVGSSTLTTGTVYFNNNVTNSTINLYGGEIVLGIDSALTGCILNIYGCALSMINNAVGASALQTLTLADGTITYLGIDVDLANKISDRLIVTSAAYGNGTITVNDINLISSSTLSNLAILFADEDFKDRVTVSVKTVTTPIYVYNVGYNSTSGDLTFTATGISPNVVTSDVAQTQAFLLQTAIDRQFFANMDAFMSFPLAQRESTICCALSNGNTTGAACPISGNGTFSPIYSCDLNRGIWVKSFTSFENIPLQNGPNVSTIEYGTLIGADAPLTYLKRGWVGNTSAYVGYLGSNQNYDGVGVSQNGVLIGLAENLVKGNNFLTLMASVGSSMGIANTPWGNDYFNSLFAGVAVKGGHNFEFKKGDYIIQPNLMLAYTYTYTPTYNTAAGIEMTSKPLNAIQIAPGLRLIKNLKEEKGQIYLIANMVFNVMDTTKFTANDVQLPELSIAPYFEYGIGYQRVWKERFTGFFQTLLRGGGRNGVALQFGMRWAI